MSNTDTKSFKEWTDEYVRDNIYKLKAPTMETKMTVYIVNYRGTIYGVFDSREKAVASEYGDLYDTNIIEMEVK